MVSVWDFQFITTIKIYWSDHKTWKKRGDRITVQPNFTNCYETDWTDEIARCRWMRVSDNFSMKSYPHNLSQDATVRSFCLSIHVSGDAFHFHLVDRNYNGAFGCALNASVVKWYCIRTVSLFIYSTIFCMVNCVPKINVACCLLFCFSVTVR